MCVVCFSIMESLSPVHAHWTSAALTVVISLPLCGGRMARSVAPRHPSVRRARVHGRRSPRCGSHRAPSAVNSRGYGSAPAAPCSLARRTMEAAPATFAGAAGREGNREGSSFGPRSRRRRGAARAREGYEQIESIDTPNDLTVLVHYKTIYSPYLTRFGTIMPKHILEKVADISASDYGRKPLGTGPFVITDFKAGDSITVERNPNYRKKGQPYLDKIIFRSVPSREVAVAQLKAGEVQRMWNRIEAQLPYLEKDANIKLSITPAPGVERIEMNTAVNKDGTDPNSVHPVLGDMNLRPAIAS